MQETGHDGGSGENGELTIITAYDPTRIPGRWRSSKVDGFAWFEPAMFDPEVYDVEVLELKRGEMDDQDG